MFLFPRSAALCIRPRDSGGGGPRSCAVEGALALPLLLPSQNFPHRPRPLHHARFARTVPLPRYRGGGQFSPVPAPHFSRGLVRMALKSLPSRGEQVLHPPKPWRRRDFPCLLRSFWRACPSKLQRRREAERRQARSYVPHLFRMRRRVACAARLPVGVPLAAPARGTLVPKAQVPGQASWDVVSLGVIQCLLSQSSGSTPRTGRNAGEHDARTRPRAECMAPRAGAAPAPPWLSTLGRRRP